MAFHLAGWYENVDPAGAFNDLTALADQTLQVNGDRIRVPSLNNIVGAAVGSESTVAARARLYSPSIDTFARYELLPHNQAAAGAVEPGSPHAFIDLRRTPLALDVDEDLRCELLSNPAAAQDQWALVWFADGPITPVEGGGIYTIRMTGTATLTAGAWSAVTLTIDDDLPVGEYEVMGMRALSAGAIGARLNFVGTGQQNRPGVLATDSVGDLGDPCFRYGRFGSFGRFRTTSLPQVDFLSVSADTAESIYLDIARVG